MAGRSGSPGEYEQRVLDVVAAIPRGRVLSYGDVAELVEAGGPRQVGAVLAAWGGAVPWWRVLRADGTPAPQLAAEALRRLAGERTPMSTDGRRVDMRRARWDGRETGDAARPGGQGRRRGGLDVPMSRG